GLGLALAAPVLARAALAGGGAGAAAVSVGARHAGLVLGLLLVTPVLAHDLRTGADRATLVGTGRVLDAPLDVATKVPLALDLNRQIRRTPRATIPALGPPFRRVQGRAPAADLAALRNSLRATIEASVTRSFRRSFGLCTLLALAAVAAAPL